MRVILQDQVRFILRLETGEEIFSALRQFAQDKQISSAYFSAIGACNEAELAFFNMVSKQYHTQRFTGEMEIASLTGNLSSLNNQVFAHAHAVLSRTDFSCLGGHVMRMLISATCEIFLVSLKGKLERSLDLATNLNLLV